MIARRIPLIVGDRFGLTKYLVLLLGLALVSACSGSAPRAHGTASDSAATATTRAAIGTGSRQFHPIVATTCADLATRASTVVPDFAAQTALYADAQARLQAVTDRTAADDAVLRYIDAQLGWLRAVVASGMGRAGPPPRAPLEAGTCRAAGTTTTSRP